MMRRSVRGDVLVIRMNHCNAGFFAQVQFALNQLRYAEAHGMVPVIEYGADSVDGPNAFFDEAEGPNVWEYYFEPIDGRPPAEVRDEAIRAGRRVLTLTYWELWRVHWHEPRSVFTYPYGYFRRAVDKTASFDREWWEDQRSKGRRLVRRYVRVRPEIIDKVDAFAAAHFHGEVIGVHARGTDKSDTGTGPGLARIVPPSEYFPYIDQHLVADPDARIFVATDQRQFVDEFRARYPDRVLTYEAARSETTVNVFQMQERAGRGNRAKGEEVLIDALLLSRCTTLLKCTSAVGEFAQYFAQDLPARDLNFDGLPSPPAVGVRGWTLRTLRHVKWRVHAVAAHLWFERLHVGLEDAAAPQRPRKIYDTNRFQART
jgi:hypothetical protein